MSHLKPIKKQIGPKATRLKWPFGEAIKACRECRNLGSGGSLADQGPFYLRPGSMDLFGGSCPGCTTLLAILSSFDVPLGLGVGDSDKYILVEFGGIVQLKYSGKFQLSLDLLLEGQENQGPSSSHDFARDTSPKRASAAAAVWIRGQLSECILPGKHGKCHNELEETLPPRLPSRILDITSPSEVKLHVSTSDERAHYIYLSHYWGTKQLIRTVKSSLERHQRGLEMEYLPKTFQHAIAVARDLDVRYIWIDSLCIIQDDIDDWRREGSKMATIYRSSFLTLSAVAANNSSGGLFFDSKDIPSQTISFEDSQQRMIVRPRQMRRDSFHWLDRATRVPLMERAWVWLTCASLRDHC